MTLGVFKPEHLRHIRERENALEQLENLGSVWIGPDIAIEIPAVIEPGQLLRNVEVVVNKSDLPHLDITRGAMGSLDLSVRSFFAQVGIDIIFHDGSLSDEMLEKIRRGENTGIPVDIENHGQRAIELDGNIMRFFWVNDHKRMRGKALLEAIKSGKFKVEGVEGEDWFLGGFNEDEKFTTASEGADQGLCVTVRLRPQKYYVPFDQKPVKKSSDRSTRDDLSNLLRPLPDDAKLRFEVGETPNIKVGPDLIAIINTGVGDNSEKHINSSLVDSGSDWPIRTETLHGLKYVEFFLYNRT